MTEPADTGHAYPGQLLASRGLIAVSVDETFFGSYITGPMRQENDGRALLLLEHLRQWSRTALQVLLILADLWSRQWGQPRGMAIQCIVLHIIQCLGGK